MPAPVTPSTEEVQDNAAFDALLWAASRPGIPRTLPSAGETSVINTLLDRECRVYSADPQLLPEIMRTGAEVAPLAQADHVFLGSPSGTEDLDHLALGSDLYPDTGATVIVRTRFGDGARLRLTGPGVDGALTVQLGQLLPEFWHKRAARLRYPMGFDLFFLDGDRVIGLPRSTDVEVL